MTLRIVAPLLGGLALLSAATPAADPAPKSGKYWVYFGTYTGGKTGSKGIYRAEFDAKSGKLSEPQVAAEVGSPSFLAIAPNGKTLYAVGETTGKAKDGGGVYAFRLDPATGGLTRLAETTSGGPGPCHVAVDPTGHLALVANYGGGSWKVFRLNPDGSFEGTSTFSQLSGSGPNKGRQEKPHAHCGAFDATGKYFFVVDLGTDQVHAHRYEFVQTPTGPERKLEILPPIKMPAGSGPRHIDLTARNDWAFVCGELDSTVNAVKLDLRGMKFEVAQSVSTLPGGRPVPGNSTAEVRVHPGGKFVYVSNRGHNSIAAFAWDGAKLSPIGHATDGIKVPRNFNIDPTGRWMLVANQDGNDVVVFAIGEDGLPKPTGTRVAVPRPVCVKFLAKP